MYLVKENPGVYFPENISIFCWTSDELMDILKYNDSSILKLGCTNDVLIEMAQSLSENSDFHTIYFCTNQKDLVWPTEIDKPKWVEVTNEKQLKRYLYSNAMIYHFNQGIEHKQNGDFRSANLSFDEAQKLHEQIKISC